MCLKSLGKWQTVKTDQKPRSVSTFCVCSGLSIPIYWVEYCSLKRTFIAMGTGKKSVTLLPSVVTRNDTTGLSIIWLLYKTYAYCLDISLSVSFSY